MVSNQTQEDQMILASWLYYESRLTHEEIASQLGMTRVAVTRLLQKARAEGIIEIHITRPLPYQYELERKLKELFGLKRVVVVNTNESEEETFNAIGRAGADLLYQLLFPGCRLGLAWSKTVSRIANYLDKPAKHLSFIVNELGGTYLSPSFPYGISWRVAEKLGVPLVSVPVPIVVFDKQARDAILREESINKALTNARNCDLAFVGIGDVTDQCSLVNAGFLTQQQITEIRNLGAVGEVLIQYYDVQGKHIPSRLDDCVISLDWNMIQKIPHIVGMASGENKKLAILGAINGKLIHSLVTDRKTAEGLIEMVTKNLAAH